MTDPNKSSFEREIKLELRVSELEQQLAAMTAERDEAIVGLNRTIDMQVSELADAQAMTREQVEERIKWYGENFVLYRTRWANELLAHDAAQRETIRRLEGERDAAQFMAKRAMDELTKAQARLTASEAKRKWTTARPTVAGWYWLRAPKHGWRDAVVWIEKDGDGPESYFYMPDDDSTPVDEIDGEWQGPLTPGE